MERVRTYRASVSSLTEVSKNNYRSPTLTLGFRSQPLKLVTYMGVVIINKPLHIVSLQT